MNILSVLTAQKIYALNQPAFVWTGKESAQLVVKEIVELKYHVKVTFYNSKVAVLLSLNHIQQCVVDE